MNEVLQYGALGILAVLILFIVPFLVKFLVNFILELKRDNQRLVQEFRTTIDNHLDHQTMALGTLAHAIEKLCAMWEENGK